MHDAESKKWVEHLRSGHPAHEEACARLHDLLLPVAVHELSRRREQLEPIAEAEFDELARQVADDALLNVLRKLDEFRGDSRFATWAYKWVTFDISDKVARRVWRRQPPSREALDWDGLPDWLAARPDDGVEQREQLKVLSAAIAELGDRQREVFVAIALNDVPIDVLALELGSNRNAVYKSLFDARRTLRSRLVAAGHDVMEEDAIQ
jgi:RNA polymerase sigma-70 factor (ECF subfamily)